MRTRDFTRFIFLDIDGVMVTNWVPYPGFGNPAAVEAVNHITDQTGAAIVVSSTWRTQGLMYCRENLIKWGVTAPVIGITPLIRKQVGSLVVSQPRGVEIAQWLDDWHEDAESFVIIDDDSDMGDLRDRLVLTQTRTGLTMELAEKAIEVLKRPVGV